MNAASSTALALPIEPLADPAPSPTANPRGHVLLAEDDREFRRLVADALTADGYVVTEVGSGRELLDGLAHVARQIDREPWVIVSDVRMPEMTGLEVLTALRMARWSTPMLLMTAFGDDDLHGDAAELGAHVLDKPFDLDALCSHVASLFAGVDSIR